MPELAKSEDLKDLDPVFLEGLQALKGKLVKVIMKMQKSVESTMGGEAEGGFYFITYVGYVQDPAVAMHNGYPCVFLETADAKRQLTALAIPCIEEIDDEVGTETAAEISMGALQSPTSVS